MIKRYLFNFCFLVMILGGGTLLDACSESAKVDDWQIRLYEINDERINWDKKVDVAFLVKKSGIAWFSDTASVKYRGGYSRAFHKKSMSLKLNNASSFALENKRKKWILNANYIDKTFLRHVISYDLFREMNPNNIAPKCDYIEVYLNDHYQGLYVLMERIDELKLTTELNAKNPIIWKEPTVFTYGRDTSRRPLGYFQKVPKVTTKDYSFFLDSLTVFLTQSTNETFDQHVFKLFDKENLIDWYILLLFSNNSDGLIKNFYLYKTALDAPFHIAPWDYDHSYGRDGDNELNLLERRLKIKRNLLFKRILENNTDDFKGQAYATWKAYRKTLLSEKALLNLVEKRKQAFEHLIPKNEKVWSTRDTTWYFDESSFDEEIALMQAYFKKRLVELDSLLAI